LNDKCDYFQRIISAQDESDLRYGILAFLMNTSEPTTRLHFPAAALASVTREIAAACRDAGRVPGEITLVAVSKTFGTDAIEPVIAAGQRVFGENRVQEAIAKWPPLLERYIAVQNVGQENAEPEDGGPKNAGLKLHMIGPLQSNKAREAVRLFDAIHTVDRPTLCAALAREIEHQGRAPLLFVEINTGAEAQKAGVLPQAADAFIGACHTDYGLTISGLMCIPPVDDPPAPHFALTAKIARRNGLPLLSMGMSADFTIAIRFGATHVRVGSAIFGHRG
jgi:pyridoxal phosphate enzyme (YggS family)